MDMASDLRANMAAHRIKAAEVADLLGLSRSQVSRIRSGESDLSIEQARVLNQHTPQLISDTAFLGKPARTAA